MSSEQTSNLWLLLETLARRRALVVWFTLVVTLLAAGVSMVLPKWYESTTTVLPPKNFSLPLEGLRQYSDIVSVSSGLSLPGLATPSDLYARLLESRTIAMRIIERFELAARYDTKNLDESLIELERHTDFRVSEEGILEITVEDREPTRAAAMANAYVEELNRINHTIVSLRIKNTRDFVESRLTQVTAERDSARSALEAFQMRYKAVDFDEQTRLAVDQATELKIELARAELQVKMNELTLGTDNADLVALKQRRDILQEQIDVLEHGAPDRSFFSLPVAAIPGLRGEYERLNGRVRVAEALYQSLLEQLENVKIKEYENLPTISVLDTAIPAELRSRPKRTYIVLAALVLSFLVAVFLAAFVDYLDRMKTDYPDDYERAVAFARAYLFWLPGVATRNSKRSA